MRTGIMTVALVVAAAAWAQAQPSGLTGTPQKDEAPDAGTPDGGAEPERPSEDEMFGAEPSAAEAAKEVREGAQDDESRRLEPGIVDRFAGGEEKEDPLDIGGLFYQRLSATNRQSASFAATALTAPTLVDGYFDARPNDRLRAMIVARMLYDPTTPSQSSTPGVGASGSASTGSTTTTLASLFPARSNPSITLDQLWLRFDVARTVFVTLGKQHVKWGAARFWNPTDFLHQVRRDPLALFDERTGVNMAKLHVPLESTGANFYGIALFDNVGSAETLGQVGGAFRAEFVVGEAEFGADAVARNGQRPRYGVDLSSALGPFDVYVEGALRPGPYTRVTLLELPPNPADPSTTRYAIGQEQQGDYSLAATGGLTWTFAYTENDTATIGAEYFYNPSGYDDPAVYPALLFTGGFQPFYIGQHYAGLFALVAGPGSWDKTSFVFSTLGNLSDRSFVSRLDFTVRVLTHLTFEANASAFYGAEQGEFRLGINLPPLEVNGMKIPAIHLPPQRFMLGVGLRLDI